MIFFMSSPPMKKAHGRSRELLYFCNKKELPKQPLFVEVKFVRHFAGAEDRAEHL